MTILDGLRGCDFSGIGDDPAIDAWTYTDVKSQVAPDPSSYPISSRPTYAPSPSKLPGAEIIPSSSPRSSWNAFDKLSTAIKSYTTPALDLSFDVTQNRVFQNYTQDQAFNKGQQQNIVSSVVDETQKLTRSAVDSIKSALTIPDPFNISPSDYISDQTRESSTYTPKKDAPLSTGSSGPSGSRGQPGTSLKSNQNSPLGIFNQVATGLVSIFAPVAARKQQRAAEQASRQPKSGGKSSGSTIAGIPTTYVLIGGGLLVGGVLLYAVTRD